MKCNKMMADLEIMISQVCGLKIIYAPENHESIRVSTFSER